MEGDTCNYLPIVKSGLLRVYKVGSNGQEVTLYRINPGESCILTISCVFSTKEFPAIAYAESDCEIFLVPTYILKEWVIRYSEWNAYIFSYMSNVLNKVILLIDDLAFQRTDLRIIDHLVKQTLKYGYSIKVTHSKIAKELGTAREVVSRALKDLEKSNFIKINRGQIEVLDLSNLQSKIKKYQFQ